VVANQRQAAAPIGYIQTAKMVALGAVVVALQIHIAIIQQALVQRGKEIMAAPVFMIHQVDEGLVAAEAVQVPQDKTE
jgi:hypothetical protein